jgi:hypothetical protein
MRLGIRWMHLRCAVLSPHERPQRRRRLEGRRASLQHNGIGFDFVVARDIETDDLVRLAVVDLNPVLLAPSAVGSPFVHHRVTAFGHFALGCR